MDIKHTKLPWAADDICAAVLAQNEDGKKFVIAFMTGDSADERTREQRKADAEFIARAVNNHDALVVDNNALRDQVQQLQRDMEGLLSAGKVLAEDIVHKQAVQDQLVAALRAAKDYASVDLGYPVSMQAAMRHIAIIDAALAAAGAA